MPFAFPLFAAAGVLAVAALTTVDDLLQLITSMLVLASTGLALTNRRKLGVLIRTTHAAHQAAKASHNALVDLANQRAMELSDEIENFKFVRSPDSRTRDDD